MPLSINEINPDVSPQTEQAILHAMGLHPQDRPDNIQQFRRELLGNAPIIIDGQVTNGWRFALWRNRILVALITALLTLAIILTLIPEIPVQSSNISDQSNPVTEINP
jgi:serine/threonine-protein kinase